MGIYCVLAILLSGLPLGDRRTGTGQTVKTAGD